MQEVKETPVREIELEGYKLPQFKIHIQNGMGEFWLFPILPTAQFIRDCFAEYKKTINGDTATDIEQFLTNPPKHITVPVFNVLFARNRFLLREGGTDSFFDFVKARLKVLEDNVARLKRELNHIDTLQIVFGAESKSLQDVYASAVNIIQDDTEGKQRESAYLNFLDAAMDSFENMLKRQSGVMFGVYEINFFKLLYRKQPMFAQRIFAYDQAMILNKGDLEMDRLLTSLFVLGWGFELQDNDQHYKRSSNQIRQIAERFLKLYLAAIAGRIAYNRFDDAEKHRATTSRKRREKGGGEVTFTELEIVNDDGSKRFVSELARELSDEDFMEQLVVKDEIERLLPKLSAGEREIVGLLLNGYKPVEIANKLNVTQQRISGALSRIRKKAQAK